MDAGHHYQQSFETPQNLSCKNYNYSFKDKQLKTGLENENCDRPSKIPIYCMSDSSGRLHFNLNVFPGSTLNPTEQQNLGRQLPEYIKDHYEEVHDKRFEKIILDECQHFNPPLQELYNDFVMRNPAFSLNYETYMEAYRHLTPSQVKSLSKSSAYFVQNNFPDHRFPGQDPLPMPSNLHGPVINSSASAISVSSKSLPVWDKRELSDKSTESFKLIDKEEDFFTQLNICRRKELLHSAHTAADTFSKNLAPDNRLNSHQLILPQSLASSHECNRTKGPAQICHLSPLPPRCSCPSKKCLILFQEQERHKICKRFWCGKTYKSKNWKWFGASVQNHYLPNPRYQSEARPLSLFIGKYFLHKTCRGRQRVCRHFFLSTLGLYFLFPLLDILNRKRQKNFQKKFKLSSQSELCKKKSKRNRSVKHHMKKHVRSYFFRHYYMKKMSSLTITSSARKSFANFSIQFPHLLDNKSHDKYQSIVHKIVNSPKFHEPSECSPTNTPHISYHNEDKQSSISFNSQPDPCGANRKIMKIKPEDIDEVIADDIAKKTHNGDEEEACDQSDSLSDEEKQSGSHVSINPDASTNSTDMDESMRRQQPHFLKKNVTNLLDSLTCQELSDHPKKSETVDKRGKRNAKQKKRKKVKNDGLRKKSGKGNPPDSRKTYKLAVNEIEGDQYKHPILPPCNCIKSKCSSKVPEQQRKAIHSNFWNLDNISRRGWMVKHVHIMKPKSRSNRATARLHQMHRKFFLPDGNGELHDVCKKFFLGTLGFKGTGVLRPQSIPGFKNTSPEKEPRKRVLSYRVSQQDVVSVIDYCKSFNKEESISFYGDEKFTRCVSSDADVPSNPQPRIRVPYGFTWKELYRDYCSKNCYVEFGYQTFRSILSIIEHNSFSVDILEKFQTAVSSNSTDNSVDEFDDTAISDSPSPSTQEQYHLLQSFPKIPKTIKKSMPEREEPVKEIPKVIVDKKLTRTRKKSKPSKSLFEPDYNLTFKCLKPRSSNNSRYNFRAGVPLVSYSFDFQNDEFYNDDFQEDVDSDDIKEEASSDQEKNKKPAKAKRKREVRASKKLKSKDRKRPEEESLDENTESFTAVGKKKRGPKKVWQLKIDMKQQESTTRLKSRHPILPPCKCNYRKCHEKITQEQREHIHNLYWSISSKQERIRWVLEHIRRCSPKSRSNTNLPSRKRETRRYFLPDEKNETTEVCRVFFLRTLGYHWDSVVDSVSRTLPRPDGYLAKSLGFSEEQLPYEVIVQIKMFLKRKKIRKSSISAEQFPDGYQTGENENEEDEDFTLEGYAMKALFQEFQVLHPEHSLDFKGFKQIVRFILIPGSEAQTEWEIKQEQLLSTHAESSFGSEGERQESAAPDDTIYFTPEFEKIDLEKALVRKARRRRPLSARNSKEQHPMREPCKCARKCREKIDQSKREQIHEFYWSLITYNQRKQWILEHIKREAPKRRTNPNGPIKKMETRKFYFEDWSGKKVEICKGFFLATLGFKWDKMVDTICKTTPRDGLYVRPDQRGKKPPSHKLSEELITSVTCYIESILETATSVFQKIPGKSNTGKQKKATDRMPYGLTMKNLFEDYKTKHFNHKVGYESFRKIYRSVIHSEKYLPSTTSSQVQDEEEEPEIDHLEHAHQHQPMANVHMMPTSIDSSSVEAAGEHEVPNFESIHPTCMFKNQANMRLLTPDHAHMPSYQRQCEPAPMKAFPENINSFSKSHDVHFYHQSLEQTEEMSMQMYKSICLPASNPNQPYAFYPNSLPLDAYSMNSGPQNIHSGLPYPDTLRHSDLMHHHAYQPPHPHFGQGRFHGFVLPGSASKEPDLSHHPHNEMNVVHNYREDFNCNPYSGKNPLVYPPTYHNADSMPSSSVQRHSFNSMPLQNPGVHAVRSCDTTSSAPSTSLLDKSYVTDALIPNCHVPSTITVNTNQSLSNDDWTSELVSPSNNVPDVEADQREKIVKKTKSRPPKKPMKEKTAKVKKVKKVRPKSKRNTREFNPMLPPCKCTIKKCLEKIPEERRKEIYELFWDLGCYNTRKQWIAENIVREDPKRRTSLDNPLRRMETRRFFLPNEKGENVEVCKGFFLRTLGFKWDKMVDTICKTTEKGQTIVRPDMRGRRRPSHKLKDEVASSIESYVRSILLAAKPAYEAQVEQSEISDDDRDIFVPYGLTMKNFHEDYKGKHAHHKVGIESFRKIFRRVSKEVLGNSSLQEGEKADLMPSPTEESSDVISPVTGLPQHAS